MRNAKRIQCERVLAPRVKLIMEVRTLVFTFMLLIDRYNMQHATLLYRWREEYLKDYWKVKNQNEKVFVKFRGPSVSGVNCFELSSKELAAKEGWEAWDVLASSTFSSFYRARNNEHVLLGDDGNPFSKHFELWAKYLRHIDVARLKPIIKIEVETIVEKRRLREKEAKMRSKQEGKCYTLLIGP